jgi:hypothetical protein
MRFRVRALMLGALVIVVLSATVTPVSANRLSLSTDWTTRAWRGTWANLTFRSAEGATAICLLTLEGSFHTNTFTKTRSTLVGYVTDDRATELECHALRRNLPWHIQYEAFSGTLPNITNVTLRLIGVELSFRPEGWPGFCLIRSTEANPLIQSLTRESGGAITSAALSGAFGTSFESCFEIRFTVEGASRSFGTPPPPPPPSTAITLSLI